MTILRAEEPRDVARIHTVHAAAFPTAAEADLVDALRRAGRLTVSLVAESDDRIVGHVAFSPVTAGDSNGLGLAPVAVLPDFQRHGVGSLLVRRGIEVCAALGAGFLVVLGDPAWYAAFGFQPASRWGLTDEYGGGDAFQALELRAGAIPRAGGLVRYAPEFSAFS